MKAERVLGLRYWKEGEMLTVEDVNRLVKVIIAIFNALPRDIQTKIKYQLLVEDL